MEKLLCFRSSCPRCEKYGDIQVVACSQENESFYLDKFHCDEWRAFDFGLFSVACYCPECKNFVSADWVINSCAAARVILFCSAMVTMYS